MLGVSVAFTVAWALLWLTEATVGSGIWLFDNLWLDFALALVPALVAGIAAAIACDRIWMGIRGRGPRLTGNRR